MLDFDDYLAAIAHEAGLIEDLLRSTGLDTPVPTCPPWTLRNLVLHLGEVHRWATVVVAGALAKPSAVPADHLGSLPGDDELLPWFAAGWSALTAALRAAPPDLAAFTFLADAPPARTFWARRQAHETGMHRVDAQACCGSIQSFDAAVAADGIDELLVGFVSRPRTALLSPSPYVLAVAPDDVDAAWLVTIAEAPPIATRIMRDAAEASGANCVLTGAASDVYVALWNRPSLGPVSVAGDRSVFDLFGASVQITW